MKQMNFEDMERENAATEDFNTHADACLATIREARERCEAEHARNNVDHGNGCISCMHLHRPRCAECVRFSLYQKMPNRFYNHTDERLQEEYRKLKRAIEQAERSGLKLRAAALLPEIESEIKRRRRNGKV